MAYCAQHPKIRAPYRCEGCESLLCEACIDESHTLLLCRLCGERAVPLDAAQPADTRQLAKVRALARPYTLKDTLGYPFRGSTPLMFFMALIAIWLSQRTLWAMIFMSALLAALQFHIVRRTVRGDNELEDWPDFTAWNELLPDLFAWIFLEFPLRALVGVYMGVGIFTGVLGIEPGLGGALILATLLWLGSAYQVMGYGAVGNYSLRYLLLVHLHVIGFRKTLGDALKFTNVMFGVRLLYMMLGGLGASIHPLLGVVLATVVEGYWYFLTPHLSGLLFRRHEDLLDDLYLDRS